MKLETEQDFLGLLKDSPLGKELDVLLYADNSYSTLPKSFFVTHLGNTPSFGKFFMGKCSGIQPGSTVRYDAERHMLRLGRYVSIGTKVRFILEGTHSITTLSTSNLSRIGDPEVKGMTGEFLGDTVVGNDVWVGDEAMILGGVTIGDGCVVGARSVIPQKKILEPYGIYAGNPARFIRYRFDEKIVEALLELKWWEKPTTWVKKHIASFHVDFTQDVGKGLGVIRKLMESA